MWVDSTSEQPDEAEVNLLIKITSDRSVRVWAKDRDQTLVIQRSRL